MIRSVEQGESGRARRIPRRALFVCGGLAACLAAGWLGSVSARPFWIAKRMKADNAHIERQILETRMDIQNLRKEAASLKTDAGMEREARRLGYVKPGEVPLIVP